MGEYGGTIKVGYIYAAALAGYLTWMLYMGILVLLEWIQDQRDERTLRELDALESEDRAAGDPPCT